MENSTPPTPAHYWLMRLVKRVAPESLTTTKCIRTAQLLLARVSEVRSKECQLLIFPNEVRPLKCHRTQTTNLPPQSGGINLLKARERSRMGNTGRQRSLEIILVLILCATHTAGRACTHGSGVDQGSPTLSKLGLPEEIDLEA
ncbi:hypothetical protein E1301_Tti015003 [Triplophysa tibetana]|uniref:Uncharacterized protein n=1 Tax=Triplophysa tibetana TaxID=1572043 RepID=A0A5A9P879_9TELE|nr:hypothetical protein E1301_Tti015003 [Triplophysa tibetana]